jgi:fatty acid desaturase
MDDSGPFRHKVDELMPLTAKSDAPAMRRAVGHLGAIVLCALALWRFRDTWWAIPLMVLMAYLVAFLFNLLHETAHQTAFSSRFWNYLLGHFAGFSMLLPYEYYRCFHWDHHRYTQDHQMDPELATPLPASLLGLLWYWAGPPVWKGRIRMLLTHGLGSHVPERWVGTNRRTPIIHEARWYLCGYALVILGSIQAQSLAAIWFWALPVTVGQLFLRPYLLSEHTGCSHTADMLQNTRTTYCSAFVRYFAWNMPFHAEHHAYPAVPFHALPKLNSLLAAHIVHTERGYHASVATVIRHLRRVSNQ